MSHWRHLKDKDHAACCDHVCWLCGQPILKGTGYRRRTGLDGREFVSMAMHFECEAETHGWDETDWEVFDATQFIRPGVKLL